MGAHTLHQGRWLPRGHDRRPQHPLGPPAANYYVCYNGWVVATTATYYAALGKIAQCQEELKSLAPWIRAMEAAQ
jgi:hypothetical protein